MTLNWDERPTELVRFSIGDTEFALWADHVSREHPILLPALGVAITCGDDDRDYAAIAADVGARSGLSALQRIDDADEHSYAAAASRGRRLHSPTWLGLSRDMRLFALGFNGIGSGNASERIWDWIAPQWHGEAMALAESDEMPVRYLSMMGRGLGPHDSTTRRLRGGCLPILDVTRHDGGVRYDLTAFVAPERTPLDGMASLGTPFLLADGHSAGHMFTDAQQAEFDRLTTDYAPAEESVLFVRMRATNVTAVPRYAFMKAPEPHRAGADTPIDKPLDGGLNPLVGALVFSSGRVAYTATLDDRPLHTEEVASLLQPGSSTTLDIRLPHRPISLARASALRDREYDGVLADVEAFWTSKLAAAATIEVPEPRITEMVAAGLLHLDLVTYGEDPGHTLAPTIGIYAPIGSESAPIIQYFDSAGRPDLAERSLRYFLDKQHDDGFMQNFGGYMLETEATLWSLGEHFRYTRDVAWAATVLPQIDRAVGYILRNRERSRQTGVPYGLLVGKTSDPEDPFASFMLNGYAVLGLSRAAEIADAVDADRAGRWRAASEELRADVRAAFADAVAHSPVVPLGDGTWVRTAPPWHGDGGPLALRRDASKWYTHGTFFARDSLNGPLWLVLQEVLDPSEQLTAELLAYAAEILHEDNTALSQPYYSPHPLIHLRRGEVNAFLRSYYTTFATLADPETYSFWEHYFHASPHKTHEEAWFLMQTRWMLYLEDGDRLRLLPGAPRAWLAPGQRIRLKGVRSYFGPLDATIQVHSGGGFLDISVHLDPRRAPREVQVRIPHHSGRRARSVSSGRYDAAAEILTLEPDAGGDVRARVHF
ncbi:hypothetical protein [Dactylosporangium salmoneum]|uniref:hypothetical protein n=1 Tax=Dactylosporangium salmoneum TaxID=53361 RepID=UPI0031D84723